MGYSYDLSTNVGKVRLLIPDNVASAYDLEDDEITYFLGIAGSNVLAAAVKSCRWLSRKYAKQATFTADGLSVQLGERAKLFAERARELEMEALGGMTTVTLDREDGYSDNASTSEYERQSKIIYIDTN